MDVAALALMASVMGVSYGWQPMPDGTRYEYVVHVSPDLAAALARGQTIPLVSDVPQGIGPIARVRVAIDGAEAPRRQLITRLKPLADAESTAAVEGEGIVLTQYTQPGGGERYGVAPAAVATAPASSAWNAGAAPPQYPPLTSQGLAPLNQPPAYLPASPLSTALNPLRSGAPPAAAPGAQQQLAEAGSTWNDAAQSAQGQTIGGNFAAAGDRLQDAASQAAQPLRDGVARVNDGLQTTAENLRGRSRELVDELQRATTRGGGAWNGGAAPGDDAGQAPELAGRPPTGAATGSAWNGSAAPLGAESSVMADRGGAQRVDRSIAPGEVGRWDNANPQAVGPLPPRPGETAKIPDRAPGPPSFASEADAADAANPLSGVHLGDGPQFPGFGTVGAGGAGADLAGRPAGREGGVARVKPAVDSRMLNQPASRPLEGPESGELAGASSRSQFDAAGPGGGNPNSATAPAATPGERMFNMPPIGQAPPPIVPGSAASDGRSTLAALAAWVLLSASVAGNLYLFWSYMDVRNKYRLLVRRSTRAVGSRLSAAG